MSSSCYYGFEGKKRALPQSGQMFNAIFFQLNGNALSIEYSVLNIRSNCVYDNLKIYYCRVSCEYHKTEEQKMKTTRIFLLLQLYKQFSYRIIRIIYSEITC